MREEIPINLSAAASFFLEMAEGERITFQIIPEGGSTVKPQIFFDYPDNLFATLSKANKARCGIFWQVNESKNGKRSNDSVTRARAFFVDLDGTPISGIITHSTPPHIVVESSPGRYHAYWKVKGVPLEQFSKYQKKLALALGGDPVVSDLARVMRVPGFAHWKSGTPFISRIQPV